MTVGQTGEGGPSGPDEARAPINFEAALAAATGEGQAGLLPALVNPYVAQMKDIDGVEKTVRWERSRGYISKENLDAQLTALNIRRASRVAELAGGLQMVAKVAFPDSPDLQDALMWKALTGENLPQAFGQEETT